MDKISVHMPGLESEGSKLAAQQAMHSQYVLQLLQLQRRAGFLCDITVNIKDKSFKAHKPLLAACSLYFRALFADSDSAKTSTLSFEELSAGGFEVLLDYIYSGSLAITSENSNQVLHAANCLQMTNVVETCLNFIRSSFKATAGDINMIEPRPPTSKDIQPVPALHASDNSQVPPLAAPTVPAIQQDLQDSRHYHSGDPQCYPVVPPSEQPLQNPKGATGHLSQSQMYEQQNQQMCSPQYQGPRQNHVVRAAKPALPAIQQSEAVEQPSPQASMITSPPPTSEALSMLMPYLVAKNARRPTLNEVRQLLLTGQRNENLPPENPERYSLEQPPPALIHARNAECEAVTALPSFTPVSMGKLPEHHTSEKQGKFPQHQPLKEQSPVNMTVSPISVAGTSHGTEDSSTTSQTTVHAGQTFDVRSAELSSKDMQPFVLMTSENNALIPATRTSSGDGSKRRAWSDDRSVGSSQTSDQSSTHLSGTPCTAGLTQGGPGADESLQQQRYSATSPASFGSTPSIEISPLSVRGESPARDSDDTPKAQARCTRAQSLDFSNIQKNKDSGDGSLAKEDLRSSSLSPGFFSDHNNNNNSNGLRLQLKKLTKGRVPGDHSALISAEQAANAVGALFVGPARNRADAQTSAEGHSSVDDSSSTNEEPRLEIEERSETSDQFTDAESKDSSAVSKRECNDAFPSTYFAQGQADALVPNPLSPNCEGLQDPKRIGQIVVKEEPEYAPRTSPPPEEEIFPPSAQEDNLSHSTVDKPECLIDENGALDLTVQKSLNAPAPKVRRVFSKTPLPQDPHNHKEALDALVMMQNVVIPPNPFPLDAMPTPTNSVVEDNNAAVALGFSRKPRRSSGGQTCQWPGCGRLFRHKNIYEEHKKLHQMGVPVHQLRKCYMGARVKKTARERLDEMRMVDSTTSPQNADGLDVAPSSSNSQRTSSKRKRTLNSQKEGLDRKRVTAKDRKDLAHNLPWQSQQSSQATIKHAPLFSHAPSIPLAVLHAVSSGHPWQGGVPQTALGYPGLPVPSVPMATSDPNHVAHLQSVTVAPNNQAVVETLAALGIPIPSKRDGEENSARLGMPNVLTPSPTKAMTMDQLRRTIALRETANASGNEASLSMQQQPIQIPLSLAHSQQAIGKFTGNQHNTNAHSIPHPAVGIRVATNHVSPETHLPVPNDNNHVNHGAKCS